LPVLKTNVHVMFRIVKGVQLVDLNFLSSKAGCLTADELPNCPLERSRFGRPLPCTLPLSTQ
jgi:hypothetical protein